MKTTFLTLFLTIFAFLNISSASIIQYEHTTGVVPINFTETFSIPKFDSSLGNLQKVEFTLTGRFNGASRTENLSPSPVTITLNNRVNFKQSIIGGSVLFDESVNKTDVFNALAWDGSFPPDWNGVSGEEYLFSTFVEQTFFLEKTDMASLALFTGIGNLDMALSASDISTTSMSGPNIVASQFENNKNIIALVKYHYTPVPEPHVYGIAGGLVCVGLIFYVRRKKLTSNEA